MAIYIKAANSDTFNLASSWTANSGVPATNDGIRFDANCGLFNTFGTGVGGVYGSYFIDSTFQTGTLTVTSGSSNTISNNSPQSGYALYIAAGKTAALMAQNWTYVGVNSVFVGAGGLYYHPSANPGFDHGNAGGAIHKFGDGEFRLGNNSTNNSATTGVGGWLVRQGKLSVYSSNATNKPFRTTANIEFNPLNVGDTPTFEFQTGGTNTTLSIANNFVFTGNGTVQTQAGTTLNLSGTASGAGTMTIGAGGGTLNWSNTVACPLNMIGTLTMSGANSITGSTITGSGTINMNGGTISANALTFSGTVNGTFTYNGVGTMAGNVAGVVSSSSGDVSFTNANNTGYIDTLGYAIVRLKNSYFSGGSGTWTLLNGNGSVSGPGMLRMVGSGANMNPGRGFGMRAGSHLILETGASVVSNQGNKGVYDDVTTPNNVSYVFSDDTSTCTLTSSFYQGATVGGSIFVMAKTGGTLVVNGNFNQDNGGGGKVYSINGGTPWGATSPSSAPTSSPNVNYKGIVRWTGTAATSGCSIAVPQGTLHINSTTETKVGTGLSVSANATLACSSTGPYAAQITGNVTFAANSTLRFGAPA